MSLVSILASCANIGMFVSHSILWFKYGLIKEDTTLWLINALGTLISFYILSYFWYYSHNRRKIETNVLVTLSLALILIIYVDNSQNDVAIDLYSFACCSVMLFFFGSPLSQIGSVVRLRDASVLLPEVTTLAFCNNLLWLLYGHMKDDPYMMVPNAIGTTLCAIQLVLIIYYGRKNASALPVAVAGGGGAATGMPGDAIPMAEIP